MTKDKFGAIVMWSTLALVVLMVGLVIAYPAKGMAVKGNVTEKMGVDEKLNKVVPLSLQFKDETGKSVMLSDYYNKGRPVVLVPIFYTCQSSCLLITEGVIEACRGIKKQDVGVLYDVVMYSINPDETPADAKVRKDYCIKYYNSKAFHPNPEKGWHCLTGDQKSIETLSEAVGFRYTFDRKKDGSVQINHPAAMMVTTPEGLIAQYFYGTEFPPKLFLTSLEAAQKERINAIVEKRVLIGCFQYNTVTGRYVWVASTGLKYAAVLMVIATFFSIMYLSFKYRTPRVVVTTPTAESAEGLSDKN